MDKIEIDPEDVLKTINFLFLIRTYECLPSHVRNMAFNYALLWQEAISNRGDNQRVEL